MTKRKKIMTDQEFQKRSEASIEALKRALYKAEGEAEFEVEEAGGALQVNFDDPPGRFVVSPNAPVKQIWISALATSFKLDWSDSAQDFVLAKTSETLKALLSRLINEQLGGEEVELQ
jgi:CyaY protein